MAIGLSSQVATRPTLRTRRTSVEKIAYLMIVLVPLQFNVGFDTRLAPADLLAVACALLIVVGRTNTPPKRLARVLIPLAIAVVVATLSGSFYNTVLYKAVIVRLGGVGILMAVAVTAAAPSSRKTINALSASAWTAIAAHATVALHLGLFEQRVRARNAGALIDPNNAGILLAFFVALELSLMRNNAFTPHTRALRVRTVKLLILLFFLVETGSRTGWVALSVSLVGMTYMNRITIRSRIRFGRRGWMRLLLLALVVASPVIIAKARHQFIEIATRPDNVARRQEVYDVSIRSFLDYPIWGRGLMHTIKLGVGFPHNTFVWLAGDAGIFGVIAVVYLVFLPLKWVTRSGWIRTESHALVMFGPLLVMGVASLAVETSFQRQWWVAIGIAATATGFRVRSSQSREGCTLRETATAPRRST